MKKITLFRILLKVTSKENIRNNDLIGANLIGANLSGANLSGANLSLANLSGANLIGANLSGANLSGANLRGANLIGANLIGANLRDADLSGANLIGANLSGANLRGADLRGANLRGADLRGADLRGANFSLADLRGAKYNYTTIGINIECPEIGSFIGFKKAKGKIITLLILEDSLRSSATTKKCRASKVKVLEIEGGITEISSDYDNNLIYKVDEIIEIKDFDINRWNECSNGIHFFMNRENAKTY